MICATLQRKKSVSKIGLFVTKNMKKIYCNSICQFAYFANASENSNTSTPAIQQQNAIDLSSQANPCVSQAKCITRRSAVKKQQNTFVINQI